MKRFFLITVFLLLPFSGAFSQMIGLLDDDQRVYKGKMENGLTYYIVRNLSTPGYADFSFVQKTGVFMEDSLTRGMIRLMEYMPLTETRNFPEGSIFTFLDNMGVDGKDGLMVSAEDDRLIISCRNVPVKKNGAVLDSMLLALYNMSSSVIFDDRSVERGKRIFQNVYSSTRTVQNRMEDSLKRYYYRGTPFAPETDRELFSRIEGYTPEEVQTFYEKICRPEFQSLIIVGDVDVSQAEMKIRSLFQLLPKKEEVHFTAEAGPLEPEGGKYFYFRDRESEKVRLSLYYLTEGTAAELKNTAVPFVYDYLSRMSVHAVQWRLRRHLSGQSFFAEGIEVGKVPFLGGEAFRVTAECAPSDYRDCYAYLISEIGSMVKDGISASEFRRSEEYFMSGLGYAYEKRNDMQNGFYTTMCLKNFLSDFSMTGIELYKSYIDHVKEKVDASVLQDFIASVFGDDGKRVVACISPEECGDLESVPVRALPFPSDSIAFVHRAVAHDKVTQNDRKFVNKSMGITSRKLSNGASVAYKLKKIEPGWVYFEAVAPGGISLLDQIHPLLQKYVNDVIRISRTGGMDMNQLAERKSSQLITLEKEISVSERKISGMFHKDHIDDFLELVHLYFLKSEPDDNLFDKFRKTETSLSSYGGVSPEELFRSMRENHFLSESMKEGSGSDQMDLSALDYHATLNLVDELFANAAEFSFIFVGDVQESLLLDMIHKHIATLPGRKVVRRRTESSDFILTGHNAVEVKKVEMAFPRCLHSCMLTFPSRMTMEERALSEVAAGIVMREIRRRISLDGILVEARKQYLSSPEESLRLEFVFSTFRDERYLEDDFREIVQDLAEKGVGENEVEAVRTNLELQDALLESRDHRFWSSLLRDRFVNRKDFYTRRESCMDQVTKEDVDLFLQRSVREGSVDLVSLVPQQKTEQYR